MSGRVLSGGGWAPVSVCGSVVGLVVRFGLLVCGTAWWRAGGAVERVAMHLDHNILLCYIANVININYYIIM